MMNLIAESIHPIGRRILPIRERVNVVSYRLNGYSLIQWKPRVVSSELASER